MVFYTVPGFCPSVEHAAGDASVTPEGKVCISYKAFKNLSAFESEVKLLTITMHEMAHLRGFDETDAQRWQLAVERTFIGESAILFDNESYSSLKKTMKTMTKSLSKAMRSLLKGNKDAACREIAAAQGRNEDAYFFGHSLPPYIKKPTEQVVGGLLGQSYDCYASNLVTIGQKLAETLKSLQELSSEYSSYESPMCTGDLCVARTFEEGDARQALILWRAHKTNFEAGSPYPSGKQNFTCSFFDILENKEIALEPLESGDYDLSSLNIPGNKELGRFSRLYGTPENSELALEIWHNGSVQMLEANGFAPSTLKITGYLVPGTQNESSVRIAVMDPKRGPGYVDPDGLPHQGLLYWFGDIKYTTIYEAPTPIKEYQITCRLVQ